MVVTYLLILTAVTGYACWRGYQLEVWVGELSKWVGELSKTVGRLENSVTKVELYPDRLQVLERKVRDEQLETKLDPFLVSANLGALSGRLDKLEKATKKPRGKK